MILQWVAWCFKALGKQIAMDGLEVKKLWQDSRNISRQLIHIPLAKARAW
jgi:hypothetical protein